MTSDRSSGLRIKICGLRSAEAACVAASEGADFLGLNFVEGVRRQLQVSEAQAIVSEYRNSGDRRNRHLGKEPKLVGLFRNQDADWVNSVSSQLELDCIQLTDDEDDAYVRSIRKPVFRQVRIRPDTTQQQLSENVQAELDAGRTVLLDRYDPQVPGGGGVAFDWSVAEGVASREGVLLAGGLNPDNVREAVRLLSPWGVDVASGVETNGEKDPQKISAFIRAARGA